MNGAFSSYLKPLFQSEAKCGAIDMKFKQINLIFLTKVLHLDLVLKIIETFWNSKWPLISFFLVGDDQVVSMPDLSVVMYQSALWNVLGSSSS